MTRPVSGPEPFDPVWVRSSADFADILDGMRQVAGETRTLSIGQYDRGREPGMLSAARIIQSHGAWSTVCLAAGLKAGSVHSTNGPTFTETDLVGAVDEFMRDVLARRRSGSFRAFASWAQEDKSRPSAALVRVRLGRWNEVKTMSLKRLGAKV